MIDFLAVVVAIGYLIAWAVPIIFVWMLCSDRFE